MAMEADVFAFGHPDLTLHLSHLRISSFHLLTAILPVSILFGRCIGSPNLRVAGMFAFKFFFVPAPVAIPACPLQDFGLVCRCWCEMLSLPFSSFSLSFLDALLVSCCPSFQYTYLLL